VTARAASRGRGHKVPGEAAAWRSAFGRRYPNKRTCVVSVHESGFLFVFTYSVHVTVVRSAMRSESRQTCARCPLRPSPVLALDVFAPGTSADSTGAPSRPRGARLRFLLCGAQRAVHGTLLFAGNVTIASPAERRRSRRVAVEACVARKGVGEPPRRPASPARSDRTRPRDR
jgi:hypothetical protein